MLNDECKSERDAVSLIETKEVSAAVTRIGGNFNQPVMYSKDGEEGSSLFQIAERELSTNTAWNLVKKVDPKNR